MSELSGQLRRFAVLPALALAVPVGITVATVVLFWTYPMSVLAVLLLGVAAGVLLQRESPRAIAFFALPTVAWLVWLLFVPLSHQGYGPALRQFIMLNLAVFLAVVIAVRVQQRRNHGANRHDRGHP